MRSVTLLFLTILSGSIGSVSAQKRPTAGCDLNGLFTQNAAKVTSWRAGVVFKEGQGDQTRVETGVVEWLRPGNGDSTMLRFDVGGRDVDYTIFASRGEITVVRHKQKVYYTDNIKPDSLFSLMSRIPVDLRRLRRDYIVDCPNDFTLATLLATRKSVVLRPKTKRSVKFYVKLEDSGLAREYSVRMPSGRVYSVWFTLIQPDPIVPVKAEDFEFKPSKDREQIKPDDRILDWPPPKPNP